jgi:hypothetical protein
MTATIIPLTEMKALLKSGAAPKIFDVRTSFFILHSALCILHLFA